MINVPILSIAGLDPTGGAGILLDIAVCAARGKPCAGAVTGIAVQTHEKAIFVEPTAPRLFRSMLEAAISAEPAAIKIGMLANRTIAEIVADTLEKTAGIPVVLDPVIRSTSGLELLDTDGVAFLRQKLLQKCDIVSPNWDEAAVLTKIPVNDIKSAAVAGKQIHSDSGVAVIVTGGHASGEPVDVLVDDYGVIELPSERINGDFRGTGCVLSSMIAIELADGKSLRRAVLSAKELLAASLAKSRPPYITIVNC